MTALTYASRFEHGGRLLAACPGASASGLAVLRRDGGNALDAAVATNLTLGVAAPYSCGFGGDLLPSCGATARRLQRLGTHAGGHDW